MSSGKMTARGESIRGAQTSLPIRAFDRSPPLLSRGAFFKDEVVPRPCQGQASESDGRFGGRKEGYLHAATSSCARSIHRNCYFYFGGFTQPHARLREMTCLTLPQASAIPDVIWSCHYEATLLSQWWPLPAHCPASPPAAFVQDASLAWNVI